MDTALPGSGRLYHHGWTTPSHRPPPPSPPIASAPPVDSRRRLPRQPPAGCRCFVDEPGPNLRRRQVVPPLCRCCRRRHMPVQPLPIVDQPAPVPSPQGAEISLPLVAGPIPGEIPNREPREAGRGPPLVVDDVTELVRHHREQRVSRRRIAIQTGIHVHQVRALAATIPDGAQLGARGEVVAGASDLIEGHFDSRQLRETPPSELGEERIDDPVALGTGRECLGAHRIAG